MTIDSAHRGLLDTGERALPWSTDLQVLYEHYHRYLLASAWVGGKDVLDLGCGEGYGSDLLAGTARSVQGLDIEAETVRHAQVRYGRDGVRFAVGSMTDAGAVEADSADVVVCFEALEHVTEHDDLLGVVRKALRPGGLFITSTPERTTYALARGGEHNPFHVGELTRSEFVDLLGGSFTNVTVLEQRIAVGSLVTSTASGALQAFALVRQGDGWSGAPLAPGTYLLGVASDADLPEVPAVSVVVDPELELVRSSQRDLYDVRSELAEARDQTAAATSRADRRAADAAANADVLRQEFAGLRQELIAARAAQRCAEQQVVDLRKRVDHLEASRVYRAYRALRAGFTALRSG